MSPGGRPAGRFLIIAVLLAVLLTISGETWVLGGQERNAASAPLLSNTSSRFLESYFNYKAAYEEPLARAAGVPRIPILAGIVNHHFLARDLMGRFFAGIDPAGVRRVILVSPDHFKHLRGGKWFWGASLLPWNTPFGTMPADAAFLQDLLGRGGGALLDRAFMQEHGIYLLVPFIKQTFPDAAVVPLILSSSRDYAQFIVLGKSLRQQDGGDAVLLVSSDFAHGVTSRQARKLDAQSLAHLQRLRREVIGEIHSDCRPCLAALLGFLGDTPPAFTLVNHKTSRDFGSPQEENLTSYITGYYRRSTEPRARILFLGDMMFDRGIRKIAARKGYDYIFADLGELLRQNHLVVANLEGPVTSNPSQNLTAGRYEKNHYTFTFDPALPGALRRHQITLVNLNNNHILDFGPKGLAETRRRLSKEQIDYFGDPENVESRPLIKNINRIKVGFLSYNQFNNLGPERTLADLQAVRGKIHLAVIYAHWGQEYHPAPSPQTRKLARQFIDAGADLVIGSHPHVVQEKEIYRGKRIYYSLGNCVFDQYFRADARQGLAVQVAIDSDLGLTFKEIPLTLNKNGQTKVSGEMVRPWIADTENRKPKTEN